MPVAARNERPGPDRWSVADVLEHLMLVEDRFKTMLADRLAEAKAVGLAAERETSSIVGSYNVAPMLDRSEKHQAPDVVAPTGMDWHTAWTRLDDARRSFTDVFRSGDGLALGDVVHKHPRLGSLNLYQWGVWLGGHEARHTEQVHEIAAGLKSEF